MNNVIHLVSHCDCPATVYLTYKNQKRLYQEQEAHLQSLFFFKKKTFLKASKERGSLDSLPIDGTKACRQISLDIRQLGLAREKGKIVNHENTGSYLKKKNKYI